MKKRGICRLFSTMLALGLGLNLAACGQDEQKKEENDEITVTYEAEDGGVIDGEGVQILLRGEKTSPVYAQADEGWVFVGWSDGFASPYRTDDTVDKDTVFTAYFEKVDEMEDDERPPSESENDSFDQPPNDSFDQPSNGEDEEKE